MKHTIAGALTVIALTAVMAFGTAQAQDAITTPPIFPDSTLADDFRVSTERNGVPAFDYIQSDELSHTNPEQLDNFNDLHDVPNNIFNRKF